MRKKIILLAILLILFSIIFFLLLDKFKINQSNDNFVNELENATVNTPSLFRIEKIVLFSSADAFNNSNQKALWDLNIYQYTNIGLYLKYDVPVKRVYLSNPNCSDYYFKAYDDFGNGKFNESDTLDKFINFDNPITLIHVNKNVATNYIIANTSELVFDGTLLGKSGVNLDSIDKEISFDINIITQNDEHFICNFNLDVVLKKSEDEDIYNGYIVETILNPDYSFEKLT